MSTEPYCPPLDEVGLSWANRARSAWRCGTLETALECARRAIAAHDRFGSKSAPEPQIIAACRVLVKRNEMAEHL